MTWKSHGPWILPLCLWLLCLGGIGVVGHHRQADRRPNFERYDDLIHRAAGRHMPEGWDWRILKAQIRKESTFDPRARSSAGAVGLCQLMPATAREMGLSRGDFFDPEPNVEAGAKYLRRMWDFFHDLEDVPDDWTRTRFALAAYNAGIGRVTNVRRKAGNPGDWQRLKPLLPAETQNYVDRIIGEFLPRMQETGGKRYAGVREPTPARLHFWTRRRSDQGNLRP